MYARVQVLANGATTTKEHTMKRTDLRIGQELALATSNDWADGSEYGIKKVTVADTRPFTARRAGYTARPDFTLEDGTTAPGYWAISPGKPTVLVRTEQGEVRLVPLTQLRGEWATCLETVQVRSAARAQAAALKHQMETLARSRVQSAAAALREAGVPLGYVADYQQYVTLSAAALEKIVELLSAQG